MAQPALLGIDLGTSSVKVVLTDLEGAVMAEAAEEYPVLNQQPGWAETDPADWLAATVSSVRKCLEKADADPQAIGLSGQMHGVVPADAAGRPVRRAMLWSDARAVQELGKYENLPDKARARLANPLTPGMAGPMLAWLAAHEPATHARTRWALQPKDWLRAQLTGCFATEPSDASATLLYDLHGDAWDTEVIEFLGLDAAILPDVLSDAGQRAGELRPHAAELLGLGAGIPVAAGAADTAAAALGSGLVQPGTAQLTIGTGAQVVTPLMALPVESSVDPVTHLYRAATERGWYAMAAVLNGGLTLAWVRQVLGMSWQELYDAALVEPAADDPFFLPHLNGERTPHMDPGMRGAWTNLAPRHDRQRLARAALEGVAFAIGDAVSCLLAPADGVDHLRLAGGGSRHPAWRQLLADVLNYPLHSVDVAAASGRGAAALGAKAAGLADEPALLKRLAPVTSSAARPQAGRSDWYGVRHQAFARKLHALRATDPDAMGPGGAVDHSLVRLGGVSQ
ncbi:MAG TPA: FGGY family carbohydrate kinase [Jatrophihabitans sp.]|uniref:xylulokinase n=1 Tax=Jatrophihabitans sp. TaxID=1932789 RepID=UPI002EF0808E